MDELSKTYTLAHPPDGWRVHFSTGIAPEFGMEPHQSLLDVIDRVEELYPEYRPRLTSSQLEDYVSELNDLVDVHGYEAFVPHAVGALMRCAPPDMPPSKRITLQRDAKLAFETGVGLPNVIEQLGSQQQKRQLSQDHRRGMDELTKTYTLAHLPEGWRVHFSTGIAPGFGMEPHYSLFEVINRLETLYPDYRPQLTTQQLADYRLQVACRGYAQELQKITSQTSELKEGLIHLKRKLPEIGLGQDREIAEDLATLHHQLSDLRAHIEIARREVALAKRIGQGEKGMGCGGLRFASVHGFMRSVQDARIPGMRSMER